MAIINFWGDVVPFSCDGIKADRSILNSIEENYNAINLECPIIEPHFDKISKAGPHLSCSESEADRFFRISDKWIVNTANNHFSDYGEKGIFKSHQFLSNRKIIHFGSGENIEIARSPKFVALKNNLKVGFLPANEVQFGIAQKFKFGVAGYDETIFSTIKKIRNECDRLIISFHAAVESWPLPSPWINKLYKTFIDVGVDIVWGHHSHVPQPAEYYNNGIIIHGYGNSYANPRNWKKSAQRLSGFASVNIDEMVLLEENWYSLAIENKDLKLAKPEKGLENLDLNKVLENYELYQGVWQEISIKLYESTFSKYLKKNFETAIRERMLRKEKQYDFSLLYHLFSCESHRQAIQTFFGLQSGEITDYRSQESAELYNRISNWMA